MIRTLLILVMINDFGRIFEERRETFFWKWSGDNLRFYFVSSWIWSGTPATLFLSLVNFLTLSGRPFRRLFFSSVLEDGKACLAESAILLRRYCRVPILFQALQSCGSFSNSEAEIIICRPGFQNSTDFISWWLRHPRLEEFFIPTRKKCQRQKNNALPNR